MTILKRSSILVVAGIAIIIFIFYRRVIENLSFAWCIVPAILIYTVCAGVLIAEQISNKIKEAIKAIQSQEEIEISPRLFRTTTDDIIRSLVPVLKFLISVLAIILLSILCIFIIIYAYNTVHGKLPKLPIDMENGANFLTLLEIVLGFIAITGGGIYLLISKSVDDRVQKTMENELKINRAEEFANNAFLIYSLFNIENKYYIDKKGEGKCSSSNYERDRLKSYLERSNHLCKKAFINLDGLPKHYKDINSDNFSDINKDLKQKSYTIALMAKNTKAYVLAWLQKNSENSKNLINKSAKKKAFSIIEEIDLLIHKEQKIHKYIPTTSHPYNYKETCAWVKYCFGNEKEKEEAEEIMENLKDEVFRQYFIDKINYQYTEFKDRDWYKDWIKKNKEILEK